MGHNSRSVSVNYTPRMTQWEAMEALHPDIRKAIHGSAFCWDACWCLRMARKYGGQWVIKALEKGDRDQIKKGLKLARGIGVKNVPGPAVPPLKPNW